MKEHPDARKRASGCCFRCHFFGGFMIKLMHLGDLHLGKSLSDFDLIRDQQYIIDQILSIADRESVDGVLIAGDVYDKSIPSEAATRLLDYFLIELEKRQIKVFMISGNHDSDDRLNYGSALFASNQIFISAVFDGTLHRETISYGETVTDIYMLPFVKASQVRHFFPDEEIESYDDAVRVIIKNTSINKDHRNILLAHQFVAGKGEDPAIAGSENLGTQSVGTVEKIYDKYGFETLNRVFQLIVATWEGDQNSLSSSMLNGVARIVDAYQVSSGIMYLPKSLEWFPQKRSSAMPGTEDQAPLALQK